MNKISPLNQEIIITYDGICQHFDLFLEEYSSKKGKKHISDIVPMFYNNFNETSDKILFVGINPSFSKNFYSSIDHNLFKYSFFRSKDFDEKASIVNELIRIQEGLINGNQNDVSQIQYFKQLQKFAIKIGYENSWNHFDIFPNRCTDQEIFIKVLEKDDFNEYKHACIKRLENLLQTHPFKAIFILNKASSIFVKNNFNNLTKIRQFSEFRNDIYGIYEFNKSPIILFKQLSQGATSNYELEIFKKIVNEHIN
jgi:hypothetical protein